ncbi:MAG: PilN domain-containing protein [Verrucomicrobia bacterium]|nr:PilN domain-containing protein [Verrucomicrobiota bacterium]MBU1734672.1 PilN domain-containing protein [Verrucomicrobiota bacterium]MBU1856126.1 PilN domain-containing protein [Verrucomicrobiota bacterium]
MARHSITGLRVRDTFLEWTTLGSGKKGIEVLAARQVQLEGDAATLADPVHRAEAIRLQCPDLTGPVTIGLAPGQMLMRVVELPTTDPVEMTDMIKLQVDQFSPFPEDRMAVSYEVLSATETTCRVLIAAVPKEQVESLGELFRPVGVTIRRIDAEIMGWWRLLADHGAIPAQGRHLLLLLEPSGGVWIAVQDGLPQAVKAISPIEGLTPEEYAEELAGDMGALIVSLDLERGVVPVGGLDCWSRDLDTTVIVARLQQELGHTVRLQSLEVLPPLSEGLARRMLVPPFAAHVRAQGIRAVLDLVPAAWRTATTSQRFQKRLILSVGAALGLWLVVVAVLFVGFQWNRLHLNRLEARLVELQKSADDVRRLQRQIHSFETYLDRQRSALECLREISAVLPKDVDLTSFQFKKGKTILLRGEARDKDPIYDFKKLLDKSPLFKSIEMGSTQPSKRKDLTVQTFQMNVQLKEDKP